MKNTKLTSVKVLEHLYNRFKIDTVDKNMTLQKLTNRCINLYLSDTSFRNKLESHDDLTVSGSNL
jgi:hypothetical protein|tara:strand:- start:1062 stop:1256 length:195 start_codon:yes stop_codon:yes gene_type:complete